MKGPAIVRKPSVCALTVLLSRRYFCLGISLILLFGYLLSALSPLRVGAIEDAPGDSRIGAVLLYNLENDMILYEREADTPIYPSSSVKIMTGMLACRALASRLDETVTVTSSMLSGVSGRQMQLVEGEQLSVRDLLYAAICGSYNDAASVLACLISGSISAFVADMNKEAERLNTACTVYTNPTGLHDPAMSTCVRDVSIIAREAYTDSLYMSISSARSHSIAATNASEERFFSNRNALISDSSQNYYNGYCKGLNAGMTDEGGWCVVTVSERGGASNLCVIMRGEEGGEDELIPAYVYTNRLLAWAGRAYTYRTVLAAGEALETVPVGMTGISKSKAELVLLSDLRVYLPAGADADAALTMTTVLTDGELNAPLIAGEPVGTVTVTYEGRVVGRGQLTVTEDFSRSGFMDALRGFRDYLCSRAFWITVAVFLALLIPFLRMTASSHGRYGIRSGRRRRSRYTPKRY